MPIAETRLSLHPLNLYRHSFSRMALSGFDFPQPMYSGISPFVYTLLRLTPEPEEYPATSQSASPLQAQWKNDGWIQSGKSRNAVNWIRLLFRAQSVHSSCRMLSQEEKL